jgi:hypothetical protein
MFFSCRWVDFRGRFAILAFGMGEKIYEMLWDCAYCGSRKLLGKTHRFCPGCGAPQDPTRRYFPPENEKIAVEDHAYFGADWICPACKSAMSSRVRFCGSCGSPKDGAASVALLAEPSKGTAAPPSKGGGVRLAWLAVPALAALPLAFWLRSRPVVVSVAGHSWSREIAVEKFGSVRESGWCDAMPKGAQSVARRRKKRSTRKVPDGQDCRPVKKDRGDGTYAEGQDCVPRLSEEPVPDDWCEYSIHKWFEERSERSEGRGLTPEPRWPELALAPQGECGGCRRQGRRREAYAVRLSEGGREVSCAMPQERWAAMAVGSRWTGRKLATGGLLCGEFTAVP